MRERGSRSATHRGATAFPLLMMSHASQRQLGSADELQFSVILEPQPDGCFTVLVPALPEVVTEGDTEGQALLNVEEAIRAVLAYRRAHGLTIPPDALPEIRRVTVAA